jgi:hypothetical protein
MIVALGMSSLDKMAEGSLKCHMSMVKLGFAVIPFLLAFL